MNIIITGSSRGIGYQIAKILSRDDQNRVIAISRNKPKLKQLQVECLNANKNSKVIPVSFDLAEKDFDPLKEEVVKYFDHVDVLINNAGIMLKKPFESSTEEEIDTLLNINLLSPVRLIKIFLPLLRRAKEGHVVNISSMAGFQGATKFPGLSFYSVSKAALSSLTECLAAEYASSSVHFNALCLGAVQTEMFESAFPNVQAPVTPGEMAEFIADFALKGNKVMNGKVVPVNLSNP